MLRCVFPPILGTACQVWRSFSEDKIQEADSQFYSPPTLARKCKFHKLCVSLLTWANVAVNDRTHHFHFSYISGHEMSKPSASLNSKNRKSSLLYCWIYEKCHFVFKFFDNKHFAVACCILQRDCKCNGKGRYFCLRSLNICWRYNLQSGSPNRLVG